MQSKLEFCKLVKCVDLRYAEDTDEAFARWQRNVLNSVGADAYTFDADEFGYVTQEFSADEVEFVEAGEVNLFAFMGSADEDERFYAKEAFIVCERATGDYYALSTEELYEI